MHKQECTFAIPPDADVTQPQFKNWELAIQDLGGATLPNEEKRCITVTAGVTEMTKIRNMLEGKGAESGLIQSKAVEDVPPGTPPLPTEAQ